MILYYHSNLVCQGLSQGLSWTHKVLCKSILFQGQRTGINELALLVQIRLYRAPRSVPMVSNQIPLNQILHCLALVFYDQNSPQNMEAPFNGCGQWVCEFLQQSLNKQPSLSLVVMNVITRNHSVFWNGTISTALSRGGRNC